MPVRNASLALSTSKLHRSLCHAATVTTMMHVGVIERPRCAHPLCYLPRSHLSRVGRSFGGRKLTQVTHPGRKEMRICEFIKLLQLPGFAELLLGNL